MEQEVHEFWLGGLEAHRHIYRVALGQLIDERYRKALNPRLLERCESNKSGSIGFMDVTKMHHFVPKEGVEDGDYSNYERVEALTIRAIGIEPGHEQKGYARMLKERAEEIAMEWGMDVIVSDNIFNPIMRGMNERMGYQMFAQGSMAVKRLNPK